MPSGVTKALATTRCSTLTPTKEGSLFAEVPQSEKNLISHRANALRAMKEKL